MCACAAVLSVLAGDVCSLCLLLQIHFIIRYKNPVTGKIEVCACVCRPRVCLPLSVCDPHLANTSHGCSDAKSHLFQFLHAGSPIKSFA